MWFYNKKVWKAKIQEGVKTQQHPVKFPKFNEAFPDQKVTTLHQKQNQRPIFKYKLTQLSFTCSKSTKETLEKNVKYVRS